MGLRDNLLAAGISATVAVGGGAALHEAIELKYQHQEQVACLSGKYPGAAACKNTLITPEITKATRETQLLYSWLAGIGLLGGAIGLMGTYGASLAAGSKR